MKKPKSTLRKRKSADVSLLILGTNPVHSLIPALMMGVDVKRQQYESLMQGERHEFKNKRLSVMFFFPYKYWDEYCENEKDGFIYGVDRKPYILFANYWKRVEKKIRTLYPDKEIDFVIDPEFVYIDRDKKLTSQILAEHGVKVTEAITSRDVDEVIAEIQKDRGIFIKSRYGAEGKGITFLSKRKWKTNYRIVGHKPKNYGVTGIWPFSDITNDRIFLKNLLKLDVVVEREVVSPSEKKDEKYDIRAYVIGERVVHIFARHAKKSKIITNWSQGGIVNDDVREILTAKQIKDVKKQALLSAKALKTRFGAIDVMFDKDGGEPYVIEAQCMCSFPKPEICMLGKELVDDLMNRS